MQMKHFAVGGDLGQGTVDLTDLPFEMPAVAVIFHTRLPVQTRTEFGRIVRPEKMTGPSDSARLTFPVKVFYNR